MDIDRVHDTFYDIANKKLSGAISPDTFNRYVYLVNMDLFKLKAGLPEDWNPNQVAHQTTFKISDDIFHLIKTLDINKTSSGYFPKPSDYAAFDYMLYGYIENDCTNTSIKWKNVEAVKGNERAIRLDSSLLPPVLEYPIVSWNSLGWKLDPDSISQIRLNYLRIPATPFWDFTMSGDQEVFRPIGVGSATVNIEWPDTMFGDFVIRVCRYAGVNLREDELVNFSLQRQEAGQ